MSSYYERQKDLFKTLKEAEEQCGYSSKNQTSKDQDYGVIDRQSYRRLKHEMKQFRGRESIFKRPEAKIRDCLRNKSVPDHMKNPQKYVYYSLSDVTADQMSDSTNAATALALIREMEERQVENIQIEQGDDGVFKKPTFRLSAAVKREIINEDTKASLRSNKVIMPEYVVGVSQNKPKKEKVKKEAGEGSVAGIKPGLKLQHLFDEEEE